VRLPSDPVAACRQLASEAEASCTHRGKWNRRDAAERYVSELEHLEAFGVPWVRARLHALVVRGAMDEMRDFHRRAVAGRSRRGNPLPTTLATFDAAGRSFWVPIEAATLADVRRAVEATNRQTSRSAARSTALHALALRMEAAGVDVVADLYRKEAA
jgi:hypothetical protein